VFDFDRIDRRLHRADDDRDIRRSGFRSRSRRRETVREATAEEKNLVFRLPAVRSRGGREAKIFGASGALWKRVGVKREMHSSCAILRCDSSRKCLF
jgi:hypothetical protein